MNKKYKIGKSIMKSRKGLVLVITLSVLLLLTLSVSASKLLNRPVEESPKETITEATVGEDINPSNGNQTGSSEGEVKKETPKQSSPTTSNPTTTSTTPSTPPNVAVVCSEALVSAKRGLMDGKLRISTINMKRDIDGYNYVHRNDLAIDDPARTVYRNTLLGAYNKQLELDLAVENADLAKYNCPPLPNTWIMY